MMKVEANGKVYCEEDYAKYDMDWRKLYFGHVPVSAMRKYTPDSNWQRVRLSMKGTSTAFKYKTLCNWLVTCEFSYASKIQVTNYVTALSRGGIIIPDAYR